MATTEQAHLLEVRDLRTQFFTRDGVVGAVNGVSFNVDRGEALGLVGESGCGKSVSALSIMGLVPRPGRVTGGEVWYGGRDQLKLTEQERQKVRGNEIAMVFQDPISFLNPVMSIGRQIAEPLKIHRGMSEKAAKARALDLMKLVGIPAADSRIDNYPHQFSGGMRQRVMIAMALSCEPKLLIADEPTTALDVTIQAQILELLQRLRAELGMALILITHDLGVVAGIVDRVNVMYAGYIVETSTVAATFADPRHPYTLGLMNSIPRVDQLRGERLNPIQGVPPDLIDTPPGCPFEPRCPFSVHQSSCENPPLELKAPDHWAACWVDVRSAPRHDPGATPPEDGSTAARLQPIARPRSPGDPDDGRDRSASAPAAAPAASDALVAVDNLKMYFPVRKGILQRRVGWVRAVDDVSFDVRRGETLGLVGESGCGKSTAGRAILQLYKPTAGNVRFDGTELTSIGTRRLRSMRRDMQIVFQDPYASLNSRLTVGSIVAEPLEIHGIGSGKDRQQRVFELLELVGLDRSMASRFPHEFSGGQRQRIGIARAIALNPKFIVCDEPISALDVSIQAQVVNLLQELQERLGLTYLFIAHDLSVVRHISDRIAVMYLGKIVEITTQKLLYDRPLHPYTMALLSAVPIPDPTVERQRRRMILTGDVPSPVNPPSGCRFHTRCPFAQQICREKEPPLDEAESGHRVACHFWSEINAAGGARSLPVVSSTGASVVASPFIDEDDGEGRTTGLTDEIRDGAGPLSDPLVNPEPVRGEPGARHGEFGFNDAVDQPQKPA